MKPSLQARIARIALAVPLVAGAISDAAADAITDWNVRSGHVVADAKLGTPPAIRVMAIVQTAALDAVNAVATPPAASRTPSTSAPVASVDAAVAAAHRVALTALVPSQRSAVEAAYLSALSAVAEGPGKRLGIAAGEHAANAVLAARAGDGAVVPETYRPPTTVGRYVPTATPAVPQWGQRKPWLMASAAQFRPGPPPALSSDAWARDFNEVKALGARSGARRDAAQDAVARFWEYSLPPIYHGVVHSVAVAPGRDVARNARLYAAVAQAMDDAMIAVFDAKYHYQFWRPATAIRNGDIDGNDATERDAAWAPLIDTPMHPEYPSAHSILAAAVGAVLEAEVGDGAMPVLATTSPTASGAVRRWTAIEDFVREVSDARVYEGVHFRTSTEVGMAMGRQIGKLAAARHAGASD